LNYDQDANVRAKLDAIARETKGYLIFSALGRDGEKYFNSAQTINPNPAQTVTQPRRYDKMRLVPFGEYVPMRALLGRFVPTIVGDFTPGTEPVVNTLRLNTDLAVVTRPDDNGGPAIERTTRFVRVGTFICYEAAYPNLVRQFVERGATLLVNISDDAWFGATAGPEQHLDHARMRAIENNRDLVRVTNSGISALIKPNGEVVEPLPQFIAATRAWQAQVRSPKTFYTRHGDWFAKLCAAISASALLAAVFVNFKRKSTARP
jgi:apolipoprotein N-acyltransferase